jgi:hypothetical protein
MSASDERDRLIRLSLVVNRLETVTARAIREPYRRRSTDVYVLGWLLATLGRRCSDHQVDQIAADLAETMAHAAERVAGGPDAEPA